MNKLNIDSMVETVMGASTEDRTEVINTFKRMKQLGFISQRMWEGFYMRILHMGIRVNPFPLI